MFARWEEKRFLRFVEGSRVQSIPKLVLLKFLGTFYEKKKVFSWGGKTFDAGESLTKRINHIFDCLNLIFAGIPQKFKSTGNGK